MNRDEFIEFLTAMDNCWLEGRFDQLSEFLAEDIVVVAPNGKHRVDGIDQAIDSYRQFMLQAHVDRFTSGNHIVTMRGDTAVVEYEWGMTWTMNDAQQDETGREVLVLAYRNSSWRVVWRTQIPIA